MNDHEHLEALLDFWLGPGDSPTPGHMKRWFTRDEAFDQSLRERFGALVERAIAGDLDPLATTPRNTLALVLLLDQLTRNIFRGTARAFAGDARAMSLVRAAIARGDDGRVPEQHRVFFYMPLMHAEDVDAQRQCVALFEALASGCPDDLRKRFEENVDYARRHRDIVERFGRFPHRNKALGRLTTDEESAFLEQPGSSF